MEYGLIFITCIFSSFLTGLLGIGGGLVIVPMFLTVLPFFGINMNIQQIIGISTACVFINSAVSVFYRRKENFIFLSKTFIFLSLSIIIGSILGTELSSHFSKNIILLVYSLVTFISLYLLKKDLFFDIKQCNLSWFLYPTFVLIGGVSATIGIGGAVLFAAALKCSIDSDTKKLLPTITLLVLINAFFTFTGKFLLGFIAWQIIPIALVSSIIGAKIGVVASKKLTTKMLNNALIGVLMLGLLRVIAEFFIK